MSLPVIIERILDAPVEKVWKAITDRDEMKKWYFELSDFKPEKGFKFSFTGHGLKGQQYVHLCEVTEVIPLKKLVYSWQYQGYEGYSEVSFELTPDGDRTRISLMHTGLESFPVSNPDFARNNFLEGWTQLIGTSLPDHLQ